MTTRWVIHARAVEDVDTTELMRHLAHEVADDMRVFVPKDKLSLRDGIKVTDVANDYARIESTRPAGGGGSGPTQEQYREEVPFFVEEGTSDTPAQPYMRPATYIYRTP